MTPTTTGRFRANGSSARQSGLSRCTIAKAHGVPSALRWQPWRFAPELSGAPAPAPPSISDPSSPAITVSLFSIGGVCAVSSTLPLPSQKVQAQVALPPGDNGMSTQLGDEIHCIAAEPHATFLRVSVMDGRHEVAYESGPGQTSIRLSHSAVAGVARDAYRAGVPPGGLWPMMRPGAVSGATRALPGPRQLCKRG
eukprot:1461166-Prymnesium_polylepis.1